VELDFDQTKHALDRFRGEETEIQSTFVAPGEYLPGQKPQKMVLRHIETKSEMVDAGKTEAERYVNKKEPRRFLHFGDGVASPWRMPEEAFEGGTWIVADTELKISGAAGVVLFRSAKPLPPADRAYDVSRIEPGGAQLPPATYQSGRRLLRGDRIQVDGHFWSVDQAGDTEGTPPWVIVRRNLQ
jgi:hypothetical protein